MPTSGNSLPPLPPSRHSSPPVDDRPLNCQRRRGGMVFVIIALALLLAIGFFFLTNQRREDAQSRAITDAAETVDNAARSVGDAAQRAMDKLRDREPKKD
ncbi:hypothetical protein [Sphingobium aromaticiconvertens]|uniref:hypothetical protein n=1 Tax=Sphingobium aromaticiconvertens TaxID=365341 RepID=UPI00301AE9E1